MEATRKPDRTPLWLTLILVLGFCLRLAGLAWAQGYCNFGATDSFEAYSVAVNYGLGDVRAQYIGQPNYNEHSKLPGPLWTIFCFLGDRLWGSIEGAILATIIVDTAAIYLIYLLAQRTLGPPAALWAALLAATLPFPVYYSAFLYNPNVMPFFGALLFLALWNVARVERSRSIFWVAMLPFAMVQFHMSTLSLMPAVLLILLMSPTRLNWRFLIGGVLAGVLLFVPYIRGEMAHGWQNTLAMRAPKAGHWWGGLKALIAPWNLLVSYVPQWTRSFAEYRELGKWCFGWFGVLLALNLLSGILAIVLLLGMGLEIKKAMQGLWRSPREAFKRSPGIVFLAVLLVVPLFCSLVSTETFHARYSIVLLAPLLSLAGYAIVKWSAQPRWGRRFVIAVIVMTCGNVWFMPAMYRHDGQQIEHGELFYASFRNLEDIYQRLKMHAGAGKAVQVDDTGYREKHLGEERIYGNAKLIRRYVLVREREALVQSGIPTGSVTYTLRDADDVTAGDGAVGYVAHGVALVAVAPGQSGGTSNIEH